MCCCRQTTQNKIVSVTSVCLPFSHKYLRTKSMIICVESVDVKVIFEITLKVILCNLVCKHMIIGIGQMRRRRVHTDYLAYLAYCMREYGCLLFVLLIY